MLASVEGLVDEAALVDSLDGSTGNGFDAAFTEEGFGPQLGSRHEAVLLETHSADAEVAEFVFVGDVDNFAQVAHTGFAQFELDIEGVFEGGALTGAGAVASADDEALGLARFGGLDDLLQFLLSLIRVIGGANG